MASTEPAAQPQGAAGLLGLLSEVAELCRAADRPDLAERALARRAALAAPSVCVVVAGDYKAGKSTLVNALVGADLCPVDDDVATVVPTFLRYAEEPTVLVHTGDGDGDREGGPSPEAVPIEDLPAWVSEAGNPANHRGIRTVEVGLPSPLLRDGIVLVDTPGVGGLGSEYTAATLASLSMADAVLFVSDSTQEYTALELEFLAAARRVCETVLPVLTKIDLFPDWDVVLRNDEAWLADADLDPELVAISAELSLRGRRGARFDLEGESGLPALIDRLRGLGNRGRTRLALTATESIHALTGQLAAPLLAEQDALADPHVALAALIAAEDDARELKGPSAEWVLLLEDGITDLEEEIDHEVSQRLLGVRRQAEQTVAATDPASSWDEFEAALTRRAGAEVAAVAQLLVDGANQLAQRISEYFAEHEAQIAPNLSAAYRGLHLPGAVGFDANTQALWRSGELFEAGWGGAEAMGAIAGMLSISIFNPFSLLIGVFIGGRSIRQARQRELEQRRQQAMEAIDRYLDDARREATRQRQFALRRIRRELRASYQRRADGLYRSARDSLAAARRMLEADHASRERRAATVASALERLRDVDRRADVLAATLLPSHGAGD